MLSLPIVLTNLLQVAYNLADTFWVGRLGQDAISAVAGQTIAFVVGTSILLSIVGYALAPWLLRLIGAEPGTQVFALSVIYTRTMFLGIPFVFGFFIFQSLLQGWVDTRKPLYLMLLGVVINVIADPFLILGFRNNLLFEATVLTALQADLYVATGFAGLGVQGAAIATIASRGLGAVVAFVLLLSGRVGIHLSSRSRGRRGRLPYRNADHVARRVTGARPRFPPRTTGVRPARVVRSGRDRGLVRDRRRHRRDRDRLRPLLPAWDVARGVLERGS